MKLSDAKKIGKAYTDDKTGITLWMHPALPMSYFSVLAFFRENGIDHSQIYPDVFMTADTCILAIESERDDLSLQAYFDMREGKTIAERYELFGMIVNIDYQGIIIIAYNNTRKEEFPSEIPPEIEADPQAKKNGSSASTKTKPKQKVK